MLIYLFAVIIMAAQVHKGRLGLAPEGGGIVPQRKEVRPVSDFELLSLILSIVTIAVMIILHKDTKK